MELADLADAFIAAAEEWDRTVAVGKKNRVFRRLTKIGEDLQSADGGREALEAMFSHSNDAVRLMSASTLVLHEVSPAAMEELKRLVVSSSGIYGFTASIMLSEVKAGRIGPRVGSD